MNYVNLFSSMSTMPLAESQTNFSAAFFLLWLLLLDLTKIMQDDKNVNSKQRKKTMEKFKKLVSKCIHILHCCQRIEYCAQIRFFSCLSALRFVCVYKVYILQSNIIIWQAHSTDSMLRIFWFTLFLFSQICCCCCCCIDRKDRCRTRLMV